MIITRSVLVDLPPRAVFRYISDFENTTAWDPGTVTTRRTSGNGGLGTRYTNISRFMGNTTQLIYTVTDYQPDRSITLVGENRALNATDTITVSQAANGATELTYQANFQFKGVWRLISPLFAPAFRRLGNQAEQGLHRALAQLASA